jgi:uncharacterized protein YggL (DUF469 family)
MVCWHRRYNLGEFQFLIGKIKTQLEELQAKYDADVFQFLIGKIKTNQYYVPRKFKPASS